MNNPEVAFRNRCCTVRCPQGNVCLAACKVKNKKHIFCEKPLAKTIEDCEEIVERQLRERQVLHGYFMRRFDSVLRRGEEKIRAGAIGKPILFGGRFRFRPAQSRRHTRGVKKGILRSVVHREMAATTLTLARRFLEGDPVDPFAIRRCLRLVHRSGRLQRLRQRFLVDQVRQQTPPLMDR